MPERTSRSQIDKLGERIRRTDALSEDDLALLQQVRSESEDTLSWVAQRLVDELGLHPGFRLKTVGTIVEKLKRESIRLSQMQDIAGARLVVEGGRSAQDVLVASILGLFTDAQVVDRREVPSHGYRAVHVIVTVDRRPVEIQVRTVLQDLWAQVFERVADRFGRGIRYGHVPEGPDLAVDGTPLAQFVAEWLRVSDVIGDLEVGRTKYPEELLRDGFRQLLESLSMGESEE